MTTKVKEQVKLLEESESLEELESLEESESLEELVELDELIHLAHSKQPKQFLGTVTIDIVYTLCGKWVDEKNISSNINDVTCQKCFLMHQYG